MYLSMTLYSYLVDGHNYVMHFAHMQKGSISCRSRSFLTAIYNTTTYYEKYFVVKSEQ